MLPSPRNEPHAHELVMWALSHGIVMHPRDNKGDGSAVHAPITASPYDFPIDAFSSAVDLAPLFNTLVDRVARDEQWLLQALRGIKESDSFTARLLDVFEVVACEGQRQAAYLGINRSDYMLHTQEESEDRNILQVEINTISSSFGALSTRIAEMFRVMERAPSGHLSTVPTNIALYELTDAIAAAHLEYVRQTCVSDAIVLMVVQPNERNFADQRLIEFELLSQHGIIMKQVTLAELAQSGEVMENGYALWYKQLEVSVAYYRAGYTPNDYPSEKEWDARLLVERSRAIKCPSIAYHLVGAKKIQQVLALPGELERFVNAKEAACLRRVFAGLYSLSDAEGPPGYTASVIEAAIANPSAYVMKPQREGGGNNIYNEQIASSLRSMSPTERAGYILMERIRPPSNSALLVKTNQVTEAVCLCELGIFGTFLGDGTRVMRNKYAGYLLRVKPEQSDEGGVAAGFSVLSAPSLRNATIQDLQTLNRKIGHPDSRTSARRKHQWGDTAVHIGFVVLGMGLILATLSLRRPLA